MEKIGWLKDACRAQRWLAGVSGGADSVAMLHLPTLRSLPVALQRAALRNFFQEHGVAGVDRALVDRGLSLLDVRNPASINLVGGARLRRRAGRLVI